MHVGILTDYPTVSFMSGPAIHTKFLSENLEARGHDVTLMGPKPPAHAPLDDADTALFSGFGFPTHPDVKIALPWPLKNFTDPPKVDLIHGQTAQHMMYYGSWLRQMHRIPVVATNTVYMPVYSGHILSERLYNWKPARDWAQGLAEGMVDGSFAKLYNDLDVFIVQNRFMVDYWRKLGVTTDIEVVGRPIDPEKFDKPVRRDPFPAHFTQGKRMLVVCRQDREKALDHIIRIFGTRIAPRDPEFSLTLIGKGGHQETLMRLAEESGYADRIWFPGEIAHEELAPWFEGADIFPYAAIFETFGNVINEALWTGLPVVAIDDQMGVAHQVEHGFNGFLVTPERPDTDELFARYCLELGANDTMRQRLGENGRRRARQVAHPDAVMRRFEAIYEQATENCHRAVSSPLVHASKAQQVKALVTRIGPWAKYNYMLLALAGVATRATGLGQKKALVLQRDEVIRRPAPAPVSILRGGTASIRRETARRSRAVAREEKAAKLTL
jgi:1,2-diacylglycerol 3-alpha-glucosyltransferase